MLFMFQKYQYVQMFNQLIILLKAFHIPLRNNDLTNSDIQVYF